MSARCQALLGLRVCPDTQTPWCHWSLKCQARGDQVLSVAALPGAQISFSDGRAELTIPAVTAAHSGRFSVRATNGAGQATSTAELLVTAETAPPNFIQRLQSMTVRQGSQVRLDIRVTGIPTPVVKFYREGAEIQSSADFQIVQEGDLYSLLIAEAFPEDSGTYSVNATNSSGRATSTAELLVQANFKVPDTGIFGFQSFNHTPSVTFSCEAREGTHTNSCQGCISYNSKIFSFPYQTRQVPSDDA
ncbi:hypothetical protein AAFF_G00328220 [Aldrovandia affinis]|uniref:Ig-like domain-containing protein n=1 Tax=Aldrovandia affinis TaxID=143900 RepID=A0AAD7T9K9_9TELE|nr:hypothetical protein AAFF_G00328220 [Aldrovandia affinis]